MAETGYYGVHERLVGRYGRAGDALYTFVARVIALAVSGLAAHLTRQPLLFPSLGPAALLFFEQPMSPGSSPRNTLIGHLVASCGPRTRRRARPWTVLIVSLGLLTKPSEMAMIVVGVAILTVAGWAINRALGVPMPLWAGRG